jgi:hypothetical protein
MLPTCQTMKVHAANKRPPVDAGWQVLFALQHAWPRATQAERWAAQQCIDTMESATRSQVLFAAWESTSTNNQEVRYER